MKRLLWATLMAASTLAQAQGAASAPASSPAKHALVLKLLQLQQPMIENIARQIVERPAMQMMQQAGNVLQSQVPADKREAIGKSIETDIKKYVEESTPLLRERAVKLAPSTYGASLEEKFTEAELKQLIAWLESPLNKKLQQVGPEIQNGFGQKLLAEAAPLIDPKLQALQQKVRASLGAPAAAPASAAKPASN